MSDEKNDVLIGTGVDWLTCTRVDAAGHSDLTDIAEDIITGFFPSEYVAKNWRAMGYKGLDFGSLKLGSKPTGHSILIMSGELARRAYPAIPIQPQWITRIDLQATVALQEPRPRTALTYYEHLRNLADGEKDAKIWKFISSNTGDTLYFGKRSHSRYFRFYDKSLDYKMDGLGWAWRYEVEFKHRTAKHIANTVTLMKDPYRDIANLVWSAFKSKGFTPAYDQTAEISVMEVALEAKTVSGTLSWFERCVSPAVTNLISLGYEKQVIEAIGLRHIAKEIEHDGSK